MASTGHGTTRREFVRECMAWAGTGLVWSASGGVLSSRAFGQPAAGGPPADFHFAQISDTHLGFAGQANPDVPGTLRASLAKLAALDPAPAFLLHTGDLTHGQKPGAFDALAEMLKAAPTREIFYVPGEHDVFADGGKEYLARYGRGTVGQGWRAFDYRGVRFFGLVNVLRYKTGGVGSLGPEQLEWLRGQLEPLPASTPIVVYTHVPLWAVYPSWGWVTEDGEQAISYLRRFGSVTVLNGHIHQVMQKIEGNIRFHTARSTAYPQPAPGTAPSPGPLRLPADRLGDALGVREVTFVPGQESLAVVDTTLA